MFLVKEESDMTKKLLLVAICAFACVSVIACDVSSATTTLPTTTQPSIDSVAPVLSGPTLFSFAAGLPINLSASSLGIGAIDNQDGDLTHVITYSGLIDFEEPGDYLLVYSVADSAGNVASHPVTIRLIDYSFKYDVAQETALQYFDITVDQIHNGNNSMIYRVTVAVKPLYAISEDVQIRMNVNTVLGYRSSGSVYFQDRARQEEVVIDLAKGVSTVSFEYTVRITAVEVQARPYTVDVLMATGQIKVK